MWSVRNSRLRTAASLNEGIVIRAGIALPLSEDGPFPDLPLALPFPNIVHLQRIHEGTISHHETGKEREREGGSSMDVLCVVFVSLLETRNVKTGSAEYAE